MLVFETGIQPKISPIAQVHDPRKDLYVDKHTVTQTANLAGNLI